MVGHYWNVPRINFHGVTVPCSHEGVSEVDGFSFWHAKVDIIDAPTLQLVLPPAKKWSRTKRSQLRIAMEAAIYRAIAKTCASSDLQIMAACGRAGG
jgi:hypothetical protein